MRNKNMMSEYLGGNLYRSNVILAHLAYVYEMIVERCGEDVGKCQSVNRRYEGSARVLQ
jgi:hypothetical protein